MFSEGYVVGIRFFGGTVSALAEGIKHNLRFALLIGKERRKKN
jgi:hypothetical protein